MGTQKDAKSYVIEHIQICITDPDNHSQLGQIYNKFPQILKYPSIYNKFKFNRLGAGNQMSSSQSSKTSIPHEVNSQSFPAVVHQQNGSDSSDDNSTSDSYVIR